MKKVICFMLVCMLVLGSFAACTTTQTTDSNKQKTESNEASEGEGLFNKTGFPIMNKPVEVTYMRSTSSTYGPFEKMHFYQAMEKVSNIKVNFLAISSEGYTEKKNLAFASGDIPDVILGLTANEIVKYGTEGKVLVPLQDLINDYGPNITKFMHKHPEAKAVTTQMDGVMYTFPKYSYTYTAGANMLYSRTDWMEKVGKKEPATVDEFLELCSAIKEWDSSKIPVTCDKGSFTNLVHYFLPAFGYLVNNLYGLDESDKVVYSPSTEQYKLTLMFLKELYSKKYLDNDCFTQGREHLVSKMKENIAMMAYYGTMLLPSNFESGEYEMVVLEPLTSQYYDKKHIIDFYPISDPGLALTNKLKYPEAMVRWNDVYYSQEDVAPDIVKGLNSVSQWLGLEGEHWEYVGAEKKTFRRIVPEGIQMSEEEYKNKHVAPGTLAGWMHFLATPEKESNPAQYMKSTQSELHLYPFFESGFKNNYMKYTPEEHERLKILENDIETYTQQMEAKFVTGQESFDNWPNFVKTLKEIGMDELLKTKQTAYERYKLLLK